MATTEERLAALEKQMAAWIDQQPTTYYTHQYSGEEIDESVGVTQDTVPTLVRPNLLDNWYFGRPVNQRGETEYAGNGYTVDRWMIGAGSNGTLSLADSGLKLARTGGIMYLTHHIAKPQIPEGSALTYSVLTTSGLFSSSFVIKNDTYHEQVVGGGISLGWNYTPAEFVEFTLVNNTANSEVTILAVKLELGDTQTLAHKEGDRWVLNEVPDYGEQLRRCQRYCYRLNSHAYGWTYNNNTVNCLIPLPVTLRATPVITIRENGTINTTTGDTSMTSYEVKNITSNGLIIDLHNTANAFTTGTPVVWHNFDMTISADL